MTEPLVSVIVPTFNRVSLLRRNLHSLLRQTVQPTLYEIIVVDNNSTDATAEAVRLLEERHAPIRYLLEPEQGIAHARNAGLQSARGRVVAYTDDDAFACPDWLRLIIESFEGIRPRPDVVGGPVLPLLLDRRHPRYRDSYDTFSWGRTPRFLEPWECFYGANVAFERQAVVEAGSFRTELGMKGDVLAYGEDNEVFERLWEYARGCLRCYYVPDAFVVHCVPSSRVRPSYRLRRGFASGQSEHQRHVLSKNERSRRPWSACYKLVHAFAETIVYPHRYPDYGNRALSCSVVMARRLGYLAGTLGIRVDLRRSR